MNAYEFNNKVNFEFKTTKFLPKTAFSILELAPLMAILTAANQSANLRLKYGGYHMPKTHFFSNPFSNPKFKNIKKPMLRNSNVVEEELTNIFHYSMYF